MLEPSMDAIFPLLTQLITIQTIITVKDGTL